MDKFRQIATIILKSSNEAEKLFKALENSEFSVFMEEEYVGNTHYVIMEKLP